MRGRRARSSSRPPSATRRRSWARSSGSAPTAARRVARASARPVKIQVEFNPATVAEYRLIGYETRMLQREDFNNDKVDAGDVGSGQTVTALYEIVPVGSPSAVDALRYAPKVTPASLAAGDEYAFVKIRYKLPKSDVSKLI